MEDKILKYFEFINESSTPETHMRSKLDTIKTKLDELIPEHSDNVENDDEIEKISVRQAKEKNEKKLTIKDLNLSQDSSEMSKGHSSIVESLTFKFSDFDSSYTLYLSTDIKDSNGATSESDISKFEVKIKKYDSQTIDYYGEIGESIEITDENNDIKVSIVKKPKEGQTQPEEKEGANEMSLEDYIIYLKLEIDKKFGDNEKLDYETE